MLLFSHLARRRVAEVDPGVAGVPGGEPRETGGAVAGVREQRAHRPEGDRPLMGV